MSFCTVHDFHTLLDDNFLQKSPNSIRFFHLDPENYSESGMISVQYKILTPGRWDDRGRRGSRSGSAAAGSVVGTSGPTDPAHPAPPTARPRP